MSFAGDAMRQLTTIAALVVALVTPAVARSRLVVLEGPTLACSDQQALETAATSAASSGNRLYCPSAQRYSIVTFGPSTKRRP